MGRTLWGHLYTIAYNNEVQNSFRRFQNCSNVIILWYIVAFLIKFPTIFRSYEETSKHLYDIKCVTFCGWLCKCSNTTKCCFCTIVLAASWKVEITFYLILFWWIICWFNSSFHVKENLYFKTYWFGRNTDYFN